MGKIIDIMKWSGIPRNLNELFEIAIKDKDRQNNKLIIQVLGATAWAFRFTRNDLVFENRAISSGFAITYKIQTTYFLQRWSVFSKG